MTEIVKSVTKYAAFVWTADSARWHMAKAWHLATTGRPGPVLLDVPLDIQGAEMNPEVGGFIDTPEACPSMKPAVYDALERLVSAERPLILAGHGIRCAQSVETFRTVAGRLNVPVVTTQLAKDLLPHAHPLFVGHPGMKGNRAANAAVQEADVILVLGSSLHLQTVGWEPELFAPQAHKIHVDPDLTILQKTRSIVQQQHRAAMQDFLSLFLLDRLRDRGEPDNSRHQEWRNRCAAWKEEDHKKRDFGNGDGPSDFYEVMDILSDELPENAVVLTDAGQTYYHTPPNLRLTAGQRFLSPGSLAEMGWALPAAIGVAAAEPDRPIVAIVGDGSLQTNIQELQTVKHYDINLKLIVINNDGYACIRGTQDKFFDGFYVGSSQETGVTLPDLAKIAFAYDLRYFYSWSRPSLRDALLRTFKTPGPVICEIFTQRSQNFDAPTF